MPDSTYFDWRLERFHHFTWPVEKAIFYKTFRQIFRKDVDSQIAWSNFRQQYGNKVIMAIYTPFFSPDLQMAYVSVSTNSNKCGWGNDYIYKKENDKWVLKYGDGEWIK